MEYMGYVIGGA
jgi:hypothetical protein